MKRSSFLIGICITVLLGLAVCVALWMGISVVMLKAMLLTVAGDTQFLLFGMGCALVLAALVAEWNVIANHVRVPELSLQTVEVTHPRLPKSLEVTSTGVLSLMFAVFFVQFVAQVYAASFTLHNTSGEIKDTLDVRMLDADNDGDLDYIAGNTDGADVDKLDIYFNGGGGAYTNTTFGNSANFTNFVTGDIDGDGDIDVVATHSTPGQTLTTYRNNGAGTFTTRFYGTNTIVHSLLLVDVDNDGDLDIVIASNSTAIVDAVFLNNGVGGFAAAVSTLPTVNAHGMAAADMNSDGFTDLIVLSGIARISYRNSGTGAFTVIDSDNMIDGPTDLALGDVDADGDIDVAMVNGNFELVIHKNDGTGNFPGGATYGTSSNALDVQLADLDNDGDLDAIIGEQGNDQHFVNDGTGIFSVSSNNGQNVKTPSTAIGDIDADGDADYVSGNGGGSALANHIFKNDQALTIVNNLPFAPITGFGATITVLNTVTTVDSSTDVGQYTSIKVPADYLPVISYFDSTFANNKLKVAKCGNAACSSGNTVTTVEAGNVGQFTSLAIGTDGLPVISYFDVSNSDLKVAKCGNAACSSGNTITTVESAFSIGQHTSIAVPSDGLPVIAYHDVGNGTLKIAKCGNAACSSGNTLSTVDSQQDIAGIWSSMAIGSDGLPVISYMAATIPVTTDIVVLKCGNTACSSGNTISTIAFLGPNESITSIAVPSDGLPFVTYSDSDTLDLVVVKCGNAACSGGNTSTSVDTAGNVGRFSSVTIGQNGLPIVSYEDATNTNLKVVQCGNAACSSGNTITTVDSQGAVGSYGSIAIGQNGLPVISYWDDTNDHLKVAKCGETSCSEGGTTGKINIRLRWGSGSDDITPLRQLQYQVRVGTGILAHSIAAARIGSPNYTPRLMPNGQSRTIYLKNQPCNTTYYWGVKTVDSGLRMSPESAEQSFTVDSLCATASPPPPPPPPPPPATGGGTLWRMARTTSGGGSAEVGKNLSGRLFVDLNGDGKKSAGERWLPMQDIVITARDAGLGQASEESTVLTASLTAEDPRKKTGETKTDTAGGYALAMLPGTHELSLNVKGLPGMEMTAKVSVDVIEGEVAVADIPVRWTTLVRHQPCMTVSGGSAGKDANAVELLKLLRDGFGKPIAVPDEQGLVQREDVVPLLAKTQCTAMPTSAAAVRGLMQQKKLTAFGDLPLSDAGKVLQTYGLVLSGVEVGKSEKVFDGLGYVNRAQMVSMVVGAMDLEEWEAGHQQMLSSVVVPKDAGVSADQVRVLMALDVLPSSMRETFAGERGVTWGEGALMLARASFAAGRIDLRSEDLKVGSVFSDLELGVCWTVDADRRRNVVVRDVTPGSPLALDAGVLMGLGVKSGIQTAWLIPGSSWMTDFGVLKGSAMLRASAPVSVVETLRELLVFSCLPPASRAEVIKAMAEGAKVDSGSAGQLLKQDLIAGVRESASFVSRVLLTAQRPMRVGNLSPVFSFTNVLVGAEGKRDVSGPVSVEEGAQMVASTVLGMLVKQGVLSRVEAEDRMSAMVMRVRVFLLDGRGEALAGQTTLTRGDLVRVMAAVARGALGEVGGGESLGETWNNRLSQ